MACQHRVDSDYCSPPLQSKIVDHSDFSDINDRPSDGDMSRKNLQKGWGGKDFYKTYTPPPLDGVIPLCTALSWKLRR